MIARILRRHTSDEGNERLPPIEGQLGQLTSAFLSLPNTKGGAGEKATSETAPAGATTKEGGESEAKKLNTEVQDSEAKVHSGEEEASEEVVCRPEKARLSSEHFEASMRHGGASPKMPGGFIIPETSPQQDTQSGTSQHQTEPRTNRATPEIQDIEKQLREKERHLQIREAEVQDVEKVLRAMERGLQIREAEVQDVEKVLRVKGNDIQIRGADVEDVEKVLLVKERDIQIRGAEVQDVEKVLRAKEGDLQIREAEVQDFEEVLRVKERDLQIRRAEVQDVEKVLLVKEGDIQIRGAEVEDAEKVLQVKERDLQILREEVQDVEKVLQMEERDLQIREAEVQMLLQAINERRGAMDLQEDNVLRRLTAMKEWEEKLRLREAALTQQMIIAGQPNGAARNSGLSSLPSISTIQNSPRKRSNVDLSPESSAGLKRDSWDHGNEASLAPTTRGGPSKNTNIGLSSNKSHARLKEDSEYFSNE